MDPIVVKIALLFLGTLSLCRSQVDAYKVSSSYRQDAKFGRPVLAMANSPRCIFNGQNVDDGRTVSSPEPCLNCTCSKGILLCYLRTCSTVVAAPGCQVVRKKGECCPKLECSRGTTEYRTERTSEPNYKYRLRQDEETFFGLLGMDPRTDRSDVTTTTTTTRKPSPKLDSNDEDWSQSKINVPSPEIQSEIIQEEDYGSDDLSPEKNESAGYCLSKGYKYTEGMAMLSPTKCEYCYCIRGQQMCVRPKCHLNIDGCVARFQSGYTCCPSHYQCEIGATGVNGGEYQFTTNSDGIPSNKVSSCNVEGYDFDVGVAVPSSGHCQTCYCTQMGVLCRRLECSPSVPGCTPVIPEGHCCPTEYKCDQGENETQVPVSHSTENFDVTVISPSETEKATSSNLFETDTTDDFNYDITEDYDIKNDDTILDTITDKQKITVELTEDSNLESISVIPEENIAVLVVTTDKNSDADEGTFENTDGTQLHPDTTKLESDSINFSNLKHKTKTSSTRASTETVSTRQPQEITKPSIISLINLKQKTSTTTDTSTENSGNYFSQDTAKPLAASLTDLKVKMKTSTTKVLSADDTTMESTPHIHTTRHAYPTTETNEKYGANQESDYNDEDKDNYAYDYVELYEDVPNDAQETFAPFAEYSEPTYGERLTSTEVTHRTHENILKIKNKNPSTTFHTRNPTTQAVITQEPLTNRLKIKNKTPSIHLQTRNPTTQTVITQGTSENRLKIKNKNPSTSLHTRNPTTQTINYYTNSKTETDVLTTERNQETVPNEGDLTYSTTNSEIKKSTDYPTRYTIYASDKTHTPHTSTIGRQKQKTKPPADPQYLSLAQYTTPFQSRDPQISTRMSQTNEYKTTSDQIFNNSYITDTSRPSLQFVKQSTKVVSNHKQRPQRPFQTASSYKSTKPLPHDIATLLWSITQRYKPENQDTSTETYESTLKQETIMNKFDHAGYLPDAPTFILAAPKLIVEDTTIENSYGTSQSDITNPDIPTTEIASSSSGSPLPSFNFQSPDFIFSNHGPSSHRKQSPVLPDSDLPVVINNHKQTSTRVRPPVRFRPPSTPSVPQTSYEEISNHRPTNSFRRPPGKFPPYPNLNQRSEPEYRSQSNARDPHHKLDAENHPEWREEYDDYDSEQNRNPSTKIFTNMQEYQTTGTINVQTTDSETRLPGSSLQPTTRKKDLNINPVTVASREDNVRKTESGIYEGTTKLQIEDEIAGRSSENKISTATETTSQTELSTTPYPTTKLDLTTSTKSLPIDPPQDNESKLFRAEDNKHIETSFIDHKQGQYDEKPNKFEALNGRFSPEKPTLKPLSSKPSVPLIQPIDPPQSEEDSKEISDVCFVDGRYYNSGEIIVKSNPCEMCRCFYGHPLCQVQQCPSPPNPSCVLEYLPGYCCPRVTCGVKADSSQLSSDVSAPDPTSQEIRSPIITSDNQWKPLPHGPVVRPVENAPKLDVPSQARIPDVVTAPQQLIHIEKESQNNENPIEIKDKESDFVVTLNANERTISTTPETLTSTEKSVTTTTDAPVTESEVTTESTTISTLNTEVTTFFPDLPITTISSSEPIGPVFEPEFHSANSEKSKSDIHDNSSGVRKVLNDTVTLPPSKMSLSPLKGENISTILPVIHEVPTTVPSTEAPDLESYTVASFVLGDLPAELGGNLKVSGCNVYGKYYKINDKVTALSKDCSDCVCTVDGISCNATC